MNHRVTEDAEYCVLLTAYSVSTGGYAICNKQYAIRSTLPRSRATDEHPGSVN
jgi:hypothetical protein